MKNCEDCKNIDGTPHDTDCPTGTLEATLDRIIDEMGLTDDPAEAKHLVREELLRFREAETARFLKTAREAAERTGRELRKQGSVLGNLSELLGFSTKPPGPDAGPEGDPDSDDPFDVIRWYLANAPNDSVVLTPELARRALVRLAAADAALERAGIVLYPVGDEDPGEQGPEPPVACGTFTEAAEDVVDNPSHYGGRDNPYETIKVMLAWYGKRATAAFCHLNAVKYLSRFAKKGEAEDRGVDLRKAAWYAKTAALIIEEGKVRP